MEQKTDIHAVVLFLLREVNGRTETLLGFGKPDKKFGAKQWNAPGGRVNDGESLIDALVREVKEEIGVLVLDHDIDMGSYLKCTIQGKDNVTHLYLAVASRWQGEPRINCDEFVKLEWFPTDQLPLSEMIAGDSRWVERFLSGEYVKGRVCHSTKQCVEVCDCEIEFSQEPFENNVRVRKTKSSAP